MIDLSARDKKDECVNKKHLVLKHEDLVDALIEIDQVIRRQRIEH
jgi:hypothetical protein